MKQRATVPGPKSLHRWRLDFNTNVFDLVRPGLSHFRLPTARESIATFAAFLDFVHPDDRSALEGLSRSQREGSDSYDIEHRIVRVSEDRIA